jgi:hypothetical protein
MLPKFKQRPLTMRAFAILLALAIGCLTPTAADDGDDFTNNLFTDLAPCVYSGLIRTNDADREPRLLALFGEQFAKQFMSQSSSVPRIDYLA